MVIKAGSRSLKLHRPGTLLRLTAIELQVRKLKVYRDQCCHGKRTFRDYPEGNTRADRTERLRLFFILLWTLGLSGLKIRLSFMTIWRDLQGQEQKIKRQNQREAVRVLGLDEANVLGWGQ